MPPALKSLAPEPDAWSLRLFAALFGAFLGLTFLKFGNPPIMEKFVSAPQDIYEFLFFSPWPIAWAYRLLCFIALLGFLGAWRMARARRSEVPARRESGSGRSRTWRVGAPCWLVALPVVWLLWQLLAASQADDARVSRGILVHFGAGVVCFYLGLFSLSQTRRLGLFWLGITTAFLLVLALGWEQHFGGLEATRRFAYSPPCPRGQAAELPPDYLEQLASHPGLLPELAGNLEYLQHLAGAPEAQRQLSRDLEYLQQRAGHPEYVQELAGNVEDWQKLATNPHYREGLTRNLEELRRIASDPEYLRELANHPDQAQELARHLEEQRKLARNLAHVQELAGNPEYLQKLSSNRIFSSLFYPNTLAGALLLLLPPVLVAVAYAKRLTIPARAFVAASLSLGALGCLYWSGSKAGWLLMLLLGILALVRLPLALQFKAALISGAILLGLFVFFWHHAAFFQKGATSVSARFDYWQAALQTARDRPLLGSGPGTFGAVYSKIKRPESEPARLTHNDYLEQASDSGIPGFLAYTSFIVGALIWTAPGRRRSVAEQANRLPSAPKSTGTEPVMERTSRLASARDSQGTDRITRGPLSAHPQMLASVAAQMGAGAPGDARGAADWQRFAVWLGVLGWSLQSLFEFGLYIPALAWPAFAFIGWLLGTDPGNPECLPAQKERA